MCIYALALVFELLLLVSEPLINHLLNGPALSRVFLSVSQIAIQCCPLKESWGKLKQFLSRINLNKFI